ncbi:TPA: 7-carboxy-7-deazaguanine synthase [Stenotrophomonas maltophilia]|nr:7-carboxy-7-deazaguanine synthase [Stenotrophomonas maltophilia]
MYAVKEIFYTLQGEGFQAGRPAVFCRFSGCNLWSGREKDRATSACTFCDTDFVGVNGVNGGKYPDDGSLPYVIADLWPHQETDNRLVVFTGGEPLLQLDEPLLRALRALGFRCAVESNGTIQPPAGIDWLTVSPKGAAPLKINRANELKLVFPQPDAPPEAFSDFVADQYFLQPLDGPDQAANTQAAIEYCKAHPKWRLSMQTHKYLGIP